LISIKEKTLLLAWYMYWQICVALSTKFS